MLRSLAAQAAIHRRDHKHTRPCAPQCCARAAALTRPDGAHALAKVALQRRWPARPALAPAPAARGSLKSRPKLRLPAGSKRCGPEGRDPCPEPAAAQRRRVGPWNNCAVNARARTARYKSHLTGPLLLVSCTADAQGARPRRAALALSRAGAHHLYGGLWPPMKKGKRGGAVLERGQRLAGSKGRSEGHGQGPGRRAPLAPRSGWALHGPAGAR